jgi:hypothetical protein
VGKAVNLCAFAGEVAGITYPMPVGRLSIILLSIILSAQKPRRITRDISMITNIAHDGSGECRETRLLIGEWLMKDKAGFPNGSRHYVLRIPLPLWSFAENLRKAVAE